MSFNDRLKAYAYLIRLDKPIGTLLLLWPTLWALWLASSGIPDFNILFIFVIGTFLMRSAGCAMNDYADRDFDRHVQRTQGRPVTSGKISGKEAVAVAVGERLAVAVGVRLLGVRLLLLLLPLLDRRVRRVLLRVRRHCGRRFVRRSVDARFGSFVMEEECSCLALDHPAAAAAVACGLDRSMKGGHACGPLC